MSNLKIPPLGAVLIHVGELTDRQICRNM